MHVIGRVTRRCFLFGFDPVSGKNFDHRKVWIENQLKTQAANFGIDLLSMAILSNHFHLILRSRPNEFELNSIRNDPEKVTTIRTRLSDVAWWMRLLCQNIGTIANKEDREVGKFFQGRYRALRILDEETLLACSAYVDLNLIRAAMAIKDFCRCQHSTIWNCWTKPPASHEPIRLARLGWTCPQSSSG